MSRATKAPSRQPRARHHVSSNSLLSSTRRLGTSSAVWISLVLALLILCFALITPPGTFLSVFNAQTLAGDASTLLILATAATFVIVSGGLDLSLGSVMTLAAVVAITTMQGLGDGINSEWLVIAIGAIAGLASGLACGAVNGVLIAYARLPAFVVTLGSLGAALGLARILSSGTTQSGAPPALQADIGSAMVLDVPVPFVIAVAVALFFVVVMALTRFGEHMYLVGSNEEAARRGGINARGVHLRLYALSGLLAALAGLVDLARFDSASISTGHTTELLAALAAVIIGGASLQGGVGGVAGTMIGVFIPVVLSNGFVILQVQRFWQDVAIGVILVGAVAFDQWRRESFAKRPREVPDERPDQRSVGRESRARSHPPAG